MSSAAWPHAGGWRRSPPTAVLELPHGLVVVGDEAVQRAVVLRLGENYRATVCSDMNVAVELLRERMKEFDFVVISEELIRSSSPRIMISLREETGLRVIVLRNEGGHEYNFEVMPNSRTEKEIQLKPVRRSTTNREIPHASSSSKLSAASPHGDSSNGSTATMVVAPAATAVVIASSVKRATNNRRKLQRAQEQYAQHQQRKPRLIWTDELRKIFIEVYEELLLTENPVPTKILKLMKLRIGSTNDPELTRDNVASYLQKYKKNLLKQKDQHLPVGNNTNISSIKIQQGSASLQQQIMHYGEYDSVNNQSLILSETGFNKHTNKQPKLLTANCHWPRNMHHHHKNNINMQPSNLLLRPNLINAKGFNMSFSKEGVDEAIYQSQLTSHRVSANHVVAKVGEDMHPISKYTPTSAAPPDAGSRRRPPPPMLELPHGLVVVGDEAVRRAVVARLGVNFRATVCSEMNAAVEMLRERMKEFDFVVIAEEFIIRSSRPEIMKFLREETGMRLLVLRNEGGNEYSFKVMSNSRMEEEGQLEPVRRSTTNREISHASLSSASSRLPPVPAASPHGRPTTGGNDSPLKSNLATSIGRGSQGSSGPKNCERYPVPSEILKLMKSMIDPMNDPKLTREKIASYLQKHKNRLKQEDQNRQNLLKQIDQQLSTDDNASTSSTQQQNMHYGEYDNMNNQPPILSESRYSEHSNKQPKLLTTNYHEPRNMYHHHKNIINMQPSNVVQPPNLISGKEFNMPFTKEGVDEAMHQSQLMAHRACTNHAVATAQANWRVTMISSTSTWLWNNTCEFLQ
uniref:Response regulatory domain-containing protein n=1 Tax=Oryza punctata TaxID=4537 RepID=A0A0E0JHT7_ORYPU